jgi:hypothetical protein
LELDTMKNTLRLVLLLAPAALAGCDGGSSSGGEAARLQIVATDAPFALSMVESAEIEVDRLSVLRDGAGDAGWHTLYEGRPILLPIDQLRNGVTQTLASGVLDTGTYRQIRLRFTGARLELVNGRVYSTDDDTLRLPSQSTSGFKIFLDPGADVTAGEERTVILDFDLRKTFKPVPANDAENASFYLLQPGIRASVDSQSAELQRVVTSAGRVEPDGAVLYVRPPGATDLAQSIGATRADGDGSYAMLGRPPGTSDLLVQQDDVETRVDAFTLSVGDVSVVDVTLP